MDMYIRMYDELKRGEGDNPTIGIVLAPIRTRTSPSILSSTAMSSFSPEI